MSEYICSLRQENEVEYSTMSMNSWTSPKPSVLIFPISTIHELGEIPITQDLRNVPRETRAPRGPIYGKTNRITERHEKGGEEMPCLGGNGLPDLANDLPTSWSWNVPKPLVR